ncbi:MAG: hypothetical protein N2321_12240 [Melioribacteraceae bacterium]|nr:hypothetical protein [Melioribacteraceae bacterium]
MKNWKKYLIYFFLFVLTLVLMINFKHKKSLFKYYDDSKNKLISYINNLNPLFAKTNLSNEDIFNFAFYKTLPIDKEKNKILIVDNINNKNLIEIKTLPIHKTENLKSYLSYINSEEKNKRKIDSVLNKYKNEVYQNIFTGDESYAINPNIILIRENLLNDLVRISQKIDIKKSEVIFSTNKIKELNNFSINKKDINKHNYFIITKDTVIETKLSFNKEMFEKHIKKLDENLVPINNELNKPFIKFKADLNKNLQSGKIINLKLDTSQIKIFFDDELVNNLVNDSLRQQFDKNIRNTIIKYDRHKYQKEKNIKKPIIIFHNPNEINNKIVNDAVNKNFYDKKNINDSIRFHKIKKDLKRANQELKKLNLDTIKIY